VKEDKALRTTMKVTEIPRQARQPKPKAPNRRHHDANIDQILGSAAKLFAEKSFGLASIREIAAEANISFPRIYYYLRNKEELLYLIAKRGMLRLFSSYPKLVKDVSDPAEKMRLFIDNHVMLSTGNTAESTVAVHETSKLSEPFLSEIRSLERQYSQTFRTLLVELARSRGKELDRNRSRILTSMFFGALNAIPNWYDSTRDSGRRQQIAEELYRLFVNAI